jgi:hypothetical protein
VQIDLADETELLANLGRNIFHELLGILDADHRTAIVYADENLPALCVGKAAYPFEILVAPGLFPLNILRFVHILFQCKVSIV